MAVLDKIKIDLKKSQINWKLALAFIPIAFFTYLFHEFGHWSVGEILGNDMYLNLNSSNAKSGAYVSESHNLYISMGGPIFTILQAILFLFITQKTKSIYAFSLVFFAAFIRFFSIIFGGFSMQDEARIASHLNVNNYLIAFIVLLILSILVWRGSRMMKLNKKTIGYFTCLSTLAILLVIGTNNWIL